MDWFSTVSAPVYTNYSETGSSNANEVRKRTIAFFYLHIYIDKEGLSRTVVREVLPRATAHEH